MTPSATRTTPPSRASWSAPHPGLTLGFNYRNARTQRWADPALAARYGHTAAYPSPGGEEAGYVLELPARD